MTAQVDPGAAPIDQALKPRPDAAAWADTLPEPKGPGEPTTDPAASSRRLLPSGLHDRFQSLKLLGEGGMGAVYRARDAVLGRDVAVKLLHAGNPHLDETLFREARSQAKLEHENVCKVYEVGAEGERRYIVMQLIEGEPLDRAKDRMTLEQNVQVVRKIASALHEVHRHGFVHRDIKPANIMVELTEDGLYKPYLMDFGLAREAGAQGKTVTGIIAGTPAFMAPEQARGEIRKLDRRTDVYSLGATLFDLLAGKPPFEAPDMWRLINKIQIDDAPSLRSLNKNIPADIDAVVTKCLEKEPHRRYESARALGEDLQRFLDGEPVRARRASLASTLYRKARRNKLAALLVAAALGAAAALTTAWVRSQEAAERQAVFSRELGEDIKEMELFLRAAYGLPTHDIDHERDIIRARLARIQRRMAAMGPLGEGPGHYALGRGHLALYEHERAREHLQRAIDAGYTSAELDYAMGLALGELYRKALEELKRIESPEKKKARLEELNAALKEPALRRLGAALGGELSSPAYVQGLIALYAESYEEAKSHARRAFKEAPWLYEAKKLEADAYFAQGSKYRHDGAFDYEKMMEYFQPAADAFQRAAEIGRSDPQVFLSACEFWRQMLSSAPSTYETASPVFATAAGICVKGIEAAPHSVEPRVYTALLYQTWSHKLMFSGTRSSAEEALRFLKDSIAIAREAAQLSPTDPMPYYVLGTALLSQVYYNNDRGYDSLPLVNEATGVLSRATETDPSFLWAHNELCKAQGEKVRLMSARGLDPAPELPRAVAACDRAIALEPGWAFPYLARAQAHFYLMLDQIHDGAVDEAVFRLVFHSITEALSRSPNLTFAYALRARSYYSKALYEMDRGDDPSGSLAMADQALEDARRISPSAWFIVVNKGLLATLRARRAALADQDPAPRIAEAREALERMVSDAPHDIDYRVHRVRPELVALAWAIRKGTAEPEHFDEALRPVLPLLAEERVHAELYQIVAEVYALKSRWLLSRKRDPEDAIRRGLATAERSLAIHPRLAAVYLLKGRLLAARAEAREDPSERAEAGALAKQALGEALKHNPLLKRQIDEDAP